MLLALLWEAQETGKLGPVLTVRSIKFNDSKQPTLLSPSFYGWKFLWCGFSGSSGVEIPTGPQADLIRAVASSQGSAGRAFF